MTSADLTFVKRLAATAAYKHGRQSLADDFVSEICVRLLAKSLPDDPLHRQRYIRQASGWAVADYLRRITVTPRRVIAKLKAGLPLTPKEQLKVGQLESVDFNQDWLRQIPVEAPPAERGDIRRELALIAKQHPVEFCVLTMHWLHEAPLRVVAEFLGVTESRACQLSQAGLQLMKRQLMKAAA